MKVYYLCPSRLEERSPGLHWRWSRWAWLRYFQHLAAGRPDLARQSRKTAQAHEVTSRRLLREPQWQLPEHVA